MPLRLGVNIDHVATLRQARYPGAADGAFVEPDILTAASVCERAGAGGITVHLRADRRHIQDRDVLRLRDSVLTKLNFEMGNTPEIVDFALRLLPDEVCLVPENRREVSTEGGLNVIAHRTDLRRTIARLQSAGIRVSLFIDPDPAQIDESAALQAEMVELHTGAYANSAGVDANHELARLRAAAVEADKAGLQVNAGHGINYTNIAEIRGLPHLAELNIGHSIVSRALFVGLESAVREMHSLMNPAD